jgi:hypothetical protein
MGTGADQVQQQLATGTAAYANIKTEHGKVGTTISRNYCTNLLVYTAQILFTKLTALI